MKYKKDYPRRLYIFFLKCCDEGTPPSFSKFARMMGASLMELEKWRRNEKFDRAWRECSEIRRDYLIDSALARRYDPSFTKFILDNEFGKSDSEGEDNEIKISIDVSEN